MSTTDAQSEPKILALEPPRAFTSPFHSQGVMAVGAAKMAFVSGQVGVRPDGSMGEGVREQTLIAIENITRVLGEGELGLADIVSLRIYLTSHHHIGPFVEAARPHFSDPRPAATLLIVPSLSNGNLLVQIEAIATR